MIYLGLGLAALFAVLAVAALALFHRYEKAQQEAVEVLQDEIEEVARWVDSH